MKKQLNEQQIEEIAKRTHEMNRCWCALNGDNSQVPWEHAPEWQRVAAICGVKFHLENPDAGPSHSHECWLRVKEAEGWTYGPLKDAEKKKHPCFVPYDHLSAYQKSKDAIFIAVIRGSLG